MANDDYGADDDIHRKPSAHTLFLDGLLSRPTARHRGASFGSGDYGRPGALSSMSAHSSGMHLTRQTRSLNLTSLIK